MEKITVTVEYSEDNFSAFVIVGDGVVTAVGNTVEELKDDMKVALEFHLDMMREDGEEIPAAFNSEYELAYKFDTESILQRYKFLFSHIGLTV